MNRRSFLKNGTCGMMRALPVINTIFNMTMAGNLARAQNTGAADYKALICLFMTGGNDSFNMLVPKTPVEYASYSATRSSVALSSNSLRSITVKNTPGRTFGIHPAMPDIANLFNAGNASFIANVGTLVEPITIQQFKANPRIRRIPISLGSHNTAQTQWQTAQPQFSSFNTGWFGRAADLLNPQLNPGSVLPMGFALGPGKTINQGKSILGAPTNTGLAIGIDGFDLLSEASANDRWMKDKFEMDDARKYQNFIQKAHREKTLEYSRISNSFQNEFQNQSTVNAFTDEPLAQKFKSVAKTISLGKNVFGVKRQTFFLDIGTFDAHSNLLVSQASLLGQINTAIKEFWKEMVAQGLQDQVTIFTGSDFGRTLRSNGDGTDHAWGGNSFVVGGALNGASVVPGSKILGNYPTALTLGTGLDTSTNGRLLPTTSIDQYYADLLLWFGISQSDLPEVLPNIGEFYDLKSPIPRLGLFSA